MANGLDVKDRLCEYFSAEDGFPPYDREEFGNLLLDAAKQVAPSDKVSRVERLGEPQSIVEDLIDKIRAYNDEVLKPLGVRGVYANEFGGVEWIDKQAPPYSGPRPPRDSMRTIFDPEFAADYLRNRLIRVGVIPIPVVSLTEVLCRLGIENGPEPVDENDRFRVLVRSLLDAPELGLVSVSADEFYLHMSGKGKTDDCLKLLDEYIRENPTEIDVMLSELFYSGTFCFTKFLFDSELGERAELYVKIKDLLVKHGDSHIMAISTRGENFVKKAMQLLVGFKGIMIYSDDNPTYN